MKHMILTIDDNPDNNKLISYYLRKDFDVLEASGGMEGLDALNKYPVDVILLDVMMPGMNGFDVLKNVVSDKKTKDIPVIMVTAKTEFEDVRQALSTGAFDYVKKPIDFIELHNKINIAIKVKTQVDELKNYSAISHLQDALVQARRLQQSLLPDKKMLASILPDSFIIDVPKDIVSGDFYWVSANREQSHISLFDSTGHGVSGAMLSIMGYMLLNEIVLHDKETDPAKIFNFLAGEINASLNRSTDTYAVHDGMDGVFCCINSNTDVLHYASANRPLILCRKNEVSLMSGTSPVKPFLDNISHSLFLLKGDIHSIGHESFDIQFKNHAVKLEPGDAIYLFTDGITDQLGGNDYKKLSKRKFFDLLLLIQDLPVKEQKTEIYNFIEQWKQNNTQTDDILVLGIKYKKHTF